MGKAQGPGRTSGSTVTTLPKVDLPAVLTTTGGGKKSRTPKADSLTGKRNSETGGQYRTFNADKAGIDPTVRIGQSEPVKASTLRADGSVTWMSNSFRYLAIQVSEATAATIEGVEPGQWLLLHRGSKADAHTPVAAFPNSDAPFAAAVLLDKNSGYATR